MWLENMAKGMCTYFSLCLIWFLYSWFENQIFIYSSAQCLSIFQTTVFLQQYLSHHKEKKGFPSLMWKNLKNLTAVGRTGTLWARPWRIMPTDLEQAASSSSFGQGLCSGDRVVEPTHVTRSYLLPMATSHHTELHVVPRFLPFMPLFEYHIWIR